MQEEHKLKAPKSAKCAILTISDSRTSTTDVSGDIIKKLLEKNNHRVIDYAIIKDDKKRITTKVNELIKKENIEAIIINGGTGVSNHDVTIETIQPKFQKELPGFSSLFSMVSFDDIGPAAYLSRATAGIINNTILFCIPGSPKAVELAMNKLILSELAHIIKHIND